MAKTKSSKTKERELRLRDGSDKHLWVTMDIGDYLIHNTGIELELVGGPYRTQKALEAAIIDKIGSSDFDEDVDTFHILSIDRRGGIGFSEFSGGFMDQMRKKAGMDPAP